MDSRPTDSESGDLRPEGAKSGALAGGPRSTRPEYWGYLEVRRLGCTDYAQARALQQELVAQRIREECGDVVLLTEHESVVTIGRGTKDDALDGVPFPLVEVERGGEATYHGPGQLVVYPILELPQGRRDLHRYLRDLEEVVLRMLAEVGIEGSRQDGLTGVWIGDRKVCSIGVAVRRWVTYHGFALNLFTDLDAFSSFQPCGLQSDVMTRVCDHVELPPANLLFEVLAVKHLCEVFDLELPPLPPAGAPGPSAAGPTDGYPELPILPS